MKILVADDEKLTREGLCARLPWKALGFSQVVQADDGIHALELCRTFRPDILLTDVRMPRMDGITLASRLQEQYPDLVIIFMSGYSDKEYLKAAIRLKAISYVEKPIDLQETEAVLREAGETVKKKLRSEHFETISRHQILSGLAVLFTQADAKIEAPALAVLKEEVAPSEHPFCFTALLQYHSDLTGNDPRMSSVFQELSELVSGMRLRFLAAVKSAGLVIFQFFSRREISVPQLSYLGQRMTDLFSEMGLHFHLVFGKQVSGLENLYLSYRSAVIALQRAFFQKENTILNAVSAPEQASFPDLSALKEEAPFEQAVRQKNKAQVFAFLDELLNRLVHDPNLLPNQVKDLYYRLFSVLRHTKSFRNDSPTEDPSGIWEAISQSSSVYALHELLKKQAEAFFRDPENDASLSSYIYMIQNYIASRLSDPDLSIKMISDHMHLSSSYICTLFKSETGITLNQYITEYRMNQAKKLLSDPRKRVAEISSAVGFSDSNYFGKAFRKYFGQSPSEFRESLNGNTAVPEEENHS